MGSFSWTKADNLTQVANIIDYKPFKFLIPKEFGGGFIKDRYQDYGYLGTRVNANGKNEEKYDMYELLAFWNADKVIPFSNGVRVRDLLRYDGEFPLMKEIDEYTDHNRSIGIDIGCYDEQIDRLKYPLKLVSASYKGTYEECEGKSYGDPNQGWSPLSREHYDELLEKKKKNTKGVV